MGISTPLLALLRRSDFAKAKGEGPGVKPHFSFSLGESGVRPHFPVPEGCEGQLRIVVWNTSMITSRYMCPNVAKHHAFSTS